MEWVDYVCYGIKERVIAGDGESAMGVLVMVFMGGAYGSGAG
jgi:hypothetical protein